MGFSVQQPPGNNRTRHVPDNRLGAVCMALYSFWNARQAAVDCVSGPRRDAYSLIFFNDRASTSIENDFASSPHELLGTALQFDPEGFSYFTCGLERAQMVMTSHWSAERYYRSFPQTGFNENITTPADINRRAPVVIFLSDSEYDGFSRTIYVICHCAARKGFVHYHRSFFFPD